MRIIGIDPGYAIVGFGIVDYSKGSFRVLDYGAITTDKDTPFPNRLCEISVRYLITGSRTRFRSSGCTSLTTRRQALTLRRPGGL